MNRNVLLFIIFIGFLISCGPAGTKKEKGSREDRGKGGIVSSGIIEEVDIDLEEIRKEGFCVRLQFTVPPVFLSTAANQWDMNMN
ncbi:MAG: hypothetical protein U5Q03_03355 [Bacteroidota bacterium]|nr:hypothetical protein [Bacteroidota bacterium]